MEKDRTNLKTHKSALGLGGTAPLNPGDAITRPLRDYPLPAAAVWDEALRAHALQSLANLAERMDVLHRACFAASVPLPGVPELDLVADVSPKAARLVVYLVPVLLESPGLVRAVTLSLGRFYETAAMVGWGTDTVPAPPEKPAALRRLLYFLSNLGGVFDEDRVLKALFPRSVPDGVVERSRRLAKLTPLQARVRDKVIADAVALEARLVPAMRVVREALLAVDGGIFDNMGDVMQPGRVKGRLLAISLMGNEGHIRRLGHAYDTFGRLQQALRGSLESDHALTQLKGLVFPLGRLRVTFADHAGLRLLFS